MAANSDNLTFGACETGSSFCGQQDKHPVIPVTSPSSGDQQDKHPIVPITSPIHVGFGRFKFMSSSVEGVSSENPSRSGGFREFLYIGCVPENPSRGTAICYGPSAGGITQNLIESANHGTRTPSGPSSSGITQNLIESINFETRTSYSPSRVDVNQNILGVVEIGSSSSCQITATPETYTVSSGGCEIYYGPGSIRISQSHVMQQNPDTNSFNISATPENNSESGSILISQSHVIQQNLDTNSFTISATSENNSELHNFHISSLTSHQNNVSVVSNTNRFQFELGSNQPDSSYVKRQNICPQRGRPQAHSSLNHGGARLSTHGHCQNHFGINRNEAGPLARGIQSIHFDRDLETSTIHSIAGHVVDESGLSEQPLRVNCHFVGKKRLYNKMAEIEDWTEDEIAILEQAIKIPCTLSRPAWLSWISGFLEAKSAFDVAAFLKYFMTERNAKRIKVDHNVMSTGTRQEIVSDPSPSSSRLAGSLGPHAQDLTSSNQAMGGEIGQLLQPASAMFPPLPVITGETTNAAPSDFRTNEEPVIPVSSPTFDFDLDLPDLSFLQSENLEDPSHLSFPPGTLPKRTGEP